MHLLLLRYPHFSLPSLDLVPEAVVRFVALQLRIDPEVLALYGRRAKTQDDHVAQIRRYLRVRAYSADDGPKLFTHLVERALHRDDPLVLIRRGRGVVGAPADPVPFGAFALPSDRPGPAPLRTSTSNQRLPHSSRRHECAALDALLEQPHGRRGFVFAWLKEVPRIASAKAIRELLRKRETVVTAGITTVDLTMLNRNRVRRLAALGRSYFNPALKRFSADKRHTMLVCTLQELEQSITDDLLEMLDVLIGRLFKTAEEEMQADQAKHGRIINSSLVILREVATVVLDTPSAGSRGAAGDLPQGAGAARATGP